MSRAILRPYNLLGGVLEADFGRFATVDEVAVKDLLADGDPELRIKSSQGTADMPARIPQLEQPHVDHIQTGAGNSPGGNAGLLHCDRPGQTPVGDVDAHAALDEFYGLQKLHEFTPVSEYLPNKPAGLLVYRFI